MGFFSSLFGKKNEEPSLTEQVAEVDKSAIPSRNDEEHFKDPDFRFRRFAEPAKAPSTYANVFNEEMAKVDGITELEKAEILSIIDGEGNYMDQSNYHKRVYQSFFKERPWSWSEFEKWDKIFLALGRYPTHCVRRSTPDNLAAFSMLTIPQLKSLLDCGAISYNSKDKKPDLALKASTLHRYQDVPEAAQKVAAHLERQDYEIYTLLLRMIQFRTNNLNRINSAKKVGGVEIGPLYLSDRDREFVDMAWKEKPHAVPPLFPGDGTCMTAKVISFD